MDEGPDKSTRMESTESPIIKTLDASISKISKACKRGEHESKEVFSLIDDSCSGKRRLVGLGPLVDCVGSYLEADGPMKADKLMDSNLSEVPVIQDMG